MACFARCLFHENVDNFFDRHEVSKRFFDSGGND